MVTHPNTPNPNTGPRLVLFDGYRLLLGLAILGYTLLFTQLAFAQHLGMRTHKADLGQIDQAVWNSSRGRFVESTDTGIIATRLTDHVEPILALISPIFWLWNDVRALLFLQVFLVALGAWPLYELALIQLDKILSPRARAQIWQIEPLRQLTRPIALALAIAYLLAPQLQSALLTEFHAAPVAVPLLLWAFWAIETQRLWPFVVATILVAMVKEEMALLAAGLAAWRFWVDDLRGWLTPARLRHADEGRRTTFFSRAITLLVLLAALCWFYLATFVIVPANAPQIYDTAESVYFGRYGALGNSPLDILKSFFTQPGLVWQIASEPARAAYFWDLLAPFGLLSLLAPEVLLLALPLLLANLLSAYPAQYYGEFHYSAPLVPYVAVSATVGLGRLWRWLGRLTARSSASYQHMAAASLGTMALASLFTNARTALRPIVALLCVLWLLGWATLTYRELGRGPWGARYDPTPITAHHRLLPRFVAQIPPDAAVTATAAVHPHVSHRRYLYQFPLGLPELSQPGQADWALLDVTTNTDMAPGDLKSAVDALLQGEWGVVDGADGFLLLRRGAPDKQIPNAFYDFARGERSATTAALATAPLTFRGVTATDWPRWRQTHVRACWQVGETFTGAPFIPQLEIITPAQEVLYAFSASVPPALLWYPPPQWQAGEVICPQTLALTLPKLWGVRVAPAPPATTIAASTQSLRQGENGATLVQIFERNEEGILQSAPADRLMPNQLAEPTQSRRSEGNFLLTEGPLQLTLWAPAQVAPATPLTLRFEWQGGPLPDWPANLAAFVHVRQGETTIAQADGPPRFFQWGGGSDTAVSGFWLAEWRQIQLPATVRPGATVTVAVGLYDPSSGARIPFTSRSAAVGPNELHLAGLSIVSPAVPDQACALIPATCASQPNP
ncbi:MAG: DUF2079 domain-containing protein [Caldilineaceae bacterium]|nr:DUF2079 domain-containing protein [Caldilineaceae bacterium]